MQEAFKHAEPVRITPSLERQQWLEAAVEALRTKFADAGYCVPEKVRVSIGWPKRAASCGAIGECWATEASSDAHNELFISPELTEAARILGVLGHEMAHATVGTAAGHKKPFKRCALAIGLQGPMRATTESPEFVTWAETLVGASVLTQLAISPIVRSRALACRGVNVRVAGISLASRQSGCCCPGRRSARATKFRCRCEPRPKNGQAVRLRAPRA